MTAADRKDQNCLKVKNVVLGAGISGLACACELNRKGGGSRTRLFLKRKTMQEGCATVLRSAASALIRQCICRLRKMPQPESYLTGHPV